MNIPHANALIAAIRAENLMLMPRIPGIRQSEAINQVSRHTVISGTVNVMAALRDMVDIQLQNLPRDQYFNINPLTAHEPTELTTELIGAVREEDYQRQMRAAQTEETELRCATCHRHTTTHDLSEEFVWANNELRAYCDHCRGSTPVELVPTTQEPPNNDE